MSQLEETGGQQAAQDEVQVYQGGELNGGGEGAGDGGGLGDADGGGGGDVGGGVCTALRIKIW